MNYYCTAKAVPAMNTLSPEEINEYMEDFGSPEGTIIVTDGYDSTYLTKPEDYKPSSRLIQYDEEYMSIEYFENGIPSWLDPIPGTTIYAADWTGDHWEYTKMEFANG